jgi:Zn-dependent protease with chaperone function
MKESARSFLLAIACLVVVPLVAVLSAAALDGKLEQVWFGEVAAHFNVSVEQARHSYNSLESICARPDRSPDIEQACSDFDAFGYLRSAGYVGLALGAFLLALVFAVARSVRGNRRLLALTFNPTVKVSIGLLCISIVIQGGILAYLAYALPAYFVGYIWPKLILVAGLASLAVTATLIRAAFGFLRLPPMKLAGIKVSEADAPGLLDLVSTTAARLGARKPNNVILGLEPSFFVTAARVQLYDASTALDGVTLYVSLPFLRLFDRGELHAVLGHELGHFKGGDLAFSMKFAPAYASLHRSLGGVASHLNTQGATSLMALPAFTVLAFVYSEFARAERTIGRARELEADKIGASVSSALSLVTALLKVSEYAGTWSGIQQFNCKMLSEGKAYRDLSELFVTLSNQRFGELDFAADKANLLSSVVAHPTDSHPTLSERMQSLGIDGDALEKGSILPSDTRLSEYLANPEGFSEKLTTLEHRLMLAFGLAELPDSSPESERPDNADAQAAAS